MADDTNDGLDDAFKGFGDDPAPVTPPATDPVTPPAAPDADAVPPKEEPKPTDEPKPPEPKADDKETPAAEQPPAADDKKTEEAPKPPETTETPPDGTPKPAETPAEPAAPLTKSDVESVVSNLLQTERTSGKELETSTQEVIDKYYPDGLSNVLVDEKSGKELRTPADVVAAAEAAGEEMTTDQAAQWLMNEQFRLDQDVAKINSDAKKIAETNLNFKRDGIAVLQKYEPLFKAYPTLQEKVFQKLMKQVKVDKEHNLILSAPDVMDYYDDYLEPYQQAFEFGTNKPATNPVPSETPEPPKPTAEDRMDEGGDGGASAATDDPNDFAQQVTKELAKRI